MKQALQLEPQLSTATTFFKEELKEKDLKEKDLKNSSKIAEEISFVNTFGQIYQYFEKRVVKNPSPIQTEILTEFFDSAMEKELLMAIMDEAGRKQTKSAPALFEKICRECIQKEIYTLDEWQRSAAQYTESNKQYKKTGTEQQPKRRSFSSEPDRFKNLF